MSSILDRASRAYREALTEQERARASGIRAWVLVANAAVWGTAHRLNRAAAAAQEQ